jgi:rhamnogalacturonan acetylesterase
MKNPIIARFSRSLLAVVASVSACLAAEPQSATTEKAASPSQSQAVSNPALPTLFIIGDSTVRNTDGKGGNGLWGWGHFIPAFVDKTKINVQNRALAGRSSRTFQTDGLWDKVLTAMKPGDFLMMQFGHNDDGPMNTGRARGSLKGIGEETEELEMPATGKKEVVHTYGWYMRKFIADTKAKGAVPIVLSPVPRNMWTDGKVKRISQTYGKWAADVAKQGGAYFIDLNEIIANRYDAEGPEKVGADYFTSVDHTHSSEAGAKLNARCVVDGLKELKDCPLLNYLSADAAPADVNEK